MPSLEHYFCYKTTSGPLCIAGNGEAVTRIILNATFIQGIEHYPDTVLNEASTQIMEYLSGKRRYFDLNFKLQGTDFEKRILSSLTHVPYAHSVTCKELAALAGMPDSYRRIGSVLAKNQLMLIIPDHRVVDAQGNAFGKGEDAKRRNVFLQFEAQQSTLFNTKDAFSSLT